MQVEDLKRWHWAMIGLIAGLILGATYRFVYPGYDPSLPTMTDQAGFEVLATARCFETGEPIARNLTVYPPTSPRSATQLVTFELREVYRLSRDTPLGEVTWTQSQWRPFKSRLEIPYDPAGPERNTFADRLRALESTGLATDLRWREAWWHRPMPGVALYGMAGLFLVGGVWPTTLNLLLGLGIARPAERRAALPKSSAPEEDLTVAPARRGVTADDMANLDTLNADLAARTAGMSVGSASPAAGASAAGTAPASPRTLTHDAPTPRQAPAPREKNEFVEDAYYPVARPGKKRGQE